MDDEGDGESIHGRDEDFMPIPNPPEGGILGPDSQWYPAATEIILLKSLQAFALQNGFAIASRGGSTGQRTRDSIQSIGVSV